MLNGSYIGGRHAVFHAIKAGRRTVHELYCLEGKRAEALADVLTLGQKLSIPVSYVDRKFFDRHLSLETHQGIAALVDDLPWAELSDIISSKNNQKKNRILLIDGVEDPHNLGALLRTALCFGIQGVIWSKKRAAPLTDTAVKAAAGAVEYLSLARVANLVRALEELKQAGYWVYGSAPEATQSLWEEDFPESAALVVGAEGRGLQRLVREHCDILLSIPCQGPVESLNASVAGGIFLSAFCSR